MRESIEVSIRTLNELLNFVGGKLELSTCNFNIIKWKFDNHALSYIEDKQYITSFADNEYSLENPKN